jgi:type IV secretion system protein VirB6
MACAPVQSGQRFVAQMIGHIDCQAQAIGSYGYGALADPSSSIAIALTGMLTLFVALFGLRLMMGQVQTGRDVVGDVLRIGIVLTLATSWPAWRTMGYDVVIDGPSQLAASISGATDLPGGRNDLVGRLQAADDNVVILTIYGTGRNTGGTDRSDQIGDSFRGIALADQEGLANGRLFFLAGIFGPLAIVKLAAGLLLALAPLMAGLLLFMGTRDLFFGWLRALGALALGAFALYVVFGVQLTVLEPWLRDAIALRDARVLTPSVPTELSVITLAFSIASFGILFILGKIFFFGGFGVPRIMGSALPASRSEHNTQPNSAAIPAERLAASRAVLVADAVAQSLRREERSTQRSEPGRVADRNLRIQAGQTSFATATQGTSPAPLGNSFRTPATMRNQRRTSAAGERRDKKA